MFHNFQEIEASLKGVDVKKRIVLAGAGDGVSVEALVRAARAGFAEPVLVGKPSEIRPILESLSEDPDDFEIVEAATQNKCARLAVQMVAEGRADVPMKGIIQTSQFLMALRMCGLAAPDSIISGCSMLHYRQGDRLIAFGDCAMTIAPTLEEKVKITRNLVGVMRALGACPVRVAEISAIESPEPHMPSSMEARQLAEMDWGPDVVVEGPLALDNALDADAAAHKGIESGVAGRPDVIVVPNIEAGNVMHKAAAFFGEYEMAGLVAGVTVPAVMCSRADTVQTKYNSIVTAAALSRAMGE